MMKKLGIVSIAAAMLCAAHLRAGAEEAKPPAWTEGLKVEKKEVGATPSLSTFGGKVYFAGQPAASDLAEFGKLGVKTVINLRTEEEMKTLGFDEKAEAEKAGMKYVNVPVGPQGISEEGLKTLMPLLDAAGKGNVLLHCKSSNRVGYVWSIFRAKQHGLSEEESLAEGKAAGLKNPELEAKAREQIGESKKP